MLLHSLHSTYRGNRKCDRHIFSLVSLQVKANTYSHVLQFYVTTNKNLFMFTGRVLKRCCCHCECCRFNFKLDGAQKNVCCITESCHRHFFSLFFVVMISVWCASCSITTSIRCPFFALNYFLNLTFNHSKSTNSTYYPLQVQCWKLSNSVARNNVYD